jgi:hypothetical protein
MPAVPTIDHGWHAVLNTNESDEEHDLYDTG